MKKYFLYLGLVGMALLSGCSSLPDMEAAKRAMEDRRPDEARKHFQELSKRGFPHASLRLGDMEQARGNRQEAIGFYKQSVAQGLDRAYIRLARLYLAWGNADDRREEQTTEFLIKAKEYFLIASETNTNAWGSLFKMALKYPQITDETELAGWFATAKSAGYAGVDLWKARQMLAGVYSVVDPFTAEKLLLKHVDNHAEARFLLGRLYLTDMLGKAQFYEGFELLNQSAEMGKAEGYLEIARTLHLGLGIAPNQAMALYYAEKAHRMGASKAAELLREIAGARWSGIDATGLMQKKRPSEDSSELQQEG